MAKKDNEVQYSKTIDVDVMLTGGKVPEYMTENAACADMYASLAESMTIYPGFRALVPLGFVTSFPSDYIGLVVPRSGRAMNEGLTILNAPGTIDSDFRGEWKAIVINHGNMPVTIEPNERIAQVVFIQKVRANFNLKKELDDTERGQGGFGSTGN